jgi:phosphate:Na+ symporter
MLEMIAGLFGGIGIFILGMVLLTDGLKNLAGESLKERFKQLTGGTGTAIFSGCIMTAILQSSHATILTTMGFVSAGLLTFQQSIGLILGANLGTTSTGWIVSLIGFKLSMGKVVFPLIGAGSMMKLLSKGKLGELGMSLAGFSLLFLGIDFLQISMKSVAGFFNPSGLSTDSFLDKIWMVLSGVGMTVVLQSSSAALATTLSALNEGAINIRQACYLVIGQNIGTTLTAGIAAVGASVAAKRTATIHIVFNVVAAIVAFSILHPLLLVMEKILDVWNMDTPVTVIAFFHSVFNILGIIVFLPFIQKFSVLVIRLLPEEANNPNRYLDPVLYHSPAVAIDTAERGVFGIFHQTLQTLRAIVSGSKSLENQKEETELLFSELTESLEFLEKVPLSPRVQETNISVLHAIDHMKQLINSFEDAKILNLTQYPEIIEKLKKELLATIDILLENWDSLDFSRIPVNLLEEKSKQLANYRKTIRLEILSTTASGKLKAAVAMKEIDSIRWFDKVYYYLWRISYHFQHKKD